MSRIFVHDNRVGSFSVRDAPAQSALEVDLHFDDVSAHPALLKRVRRLFDLDADAEAIALKLSADSKLAALIEKHPGTRLPTGWDAFEIAISTILGQLVSLASARALVFTLINELGEDSGLAKDGRSIRLFPGPDAIWRADLSFLKTTGARKRTLISFAKAVSDGSVRFDDDQESEEFIENLVKLPGIGPWTATYIAMKALRASNAFPASDLILARALEIHPRSVIEETKPYRGYAAALLWREYAESLSRRTPVPRASKSPGKTEGRTVQGTSRRSPKASPRDED